MWLRDKTEKLESLVLPLDVASFSRVCQVRKQIISHRYACLMYIEVLSVAYTQQWISNEHDEDDEESAQPSDQGHPAFVVLARILTCSTALFPINSPKSPPKSSRSRRPTFFPAKTSLQFSS